MNTDIYDTWIETERGQRMHLDVIVPQGNDQAAEYAREWLRTVGVDPLSLTQERCRFCHSAPHPELAEVIDRQGYAIIQMEGCPAPVGLAQGAGS